MSSIPMYFPPLPFDLQEARICADLVDTAYDMYAQWLAQDKPDRHHFKWTPKGPQMHYSQPIWGVERFFFDLLKNHEPFAFVSWNDDGVAYLVFRGTESVDDWVEDLDADQAAYTPVAGYGKVHDGFMRVYGSMADDVVAAVKAVSGLSKLFITGHSLGSGLSTLAVPDVVARCGIQPSQTPVLHYNLASPRVGDTAFAGAYNSNGVPTYRIVNTCDVVPEVPASVFGDIVYEHVGTPVDFTAQYGSVAGNHSAENAYRYALLHPGDPQSGG